jgi:hypothetical protein
MSAVADTSSSSATPSMALDDVTSSADVDTSVSVEQVALPSTLDGVWGMFELRRRPTVLMNGVPLVRETVDPDSEFVFDVYYRSTAAAGDGDLARMPEVVFDSDLGRANGGAGALALTAAAHAHVDDNEDLDAVEHEYPGPSDEERDDEDEERGGGARSRAQRRHGDNDDEPNQRGAAADDNSSDDDERRHAVDDEDDDLFAANAADVISDVIEREFYFGDYGRDDDFDPDDANF